ncbi:MAG: hypothetical protein LAP39_05670 [Acidobacteriia bacterium]|nr:hypothetical protein [Terriglobia bacterium]
MYKQRNFCFVVLLAVCCACAAERPAVTGAQTPGMVWKAKLFGEIPAEKSNVDGRSVKLTPLPGGIRCEFEKGNGFDIPFSSVVEIAHDVTTRNRGAILLQYFREHLDAYTCSHDCTVAIMLAPVFAPFTRHKHYVALGWREDSSMRRAVFRLRKRDYRAFIAALSTASGQPSWDIAEEHQKLRRELKRQLKSSISVHLKHDVVLGEAVLKRRSYRMLLVDRQGGEGEVSFFAAYKHVLTMPVDLVAGGAVASTAVIYKPSPPRDWAITEIRIPGKILRFRSAEPNTPQDLATDIQPDREH